MTAVTGRKGSVDVQSALVRLHRSHLHRDPAHRAADRRTSLGRARRCVPRRVVVFTHDTSDAGWRHRFWLTRDYLHEVTALVAGRPALIELTRAIGARTEPVLIPWDCADGFFEAYW